MHTYLHKAIALLVSWKTRPRTPAQRCTVVEFAGRGNWATKPPVRDWWAGNRPHPRGEELGASWALHGILGNTSTAAQNWTVQTLKFRRPLTLNKSTTKAQNRNNKGTTKAQRRHNEGKNSPREPSLMNNKITRQFLLSASMARAKRGRSSDQSELSCDISDTDPNVCKAFARGKRKLEVFLQTDDGKKMLRQEAKLYAGDEDVAKEAIFTMLKQKILENLRKKPPSNADSGRSKASTLAPAIRETGHDALQQWVHAVREDPKCQTAQFCDILRVVGDTLQRARKQNRVPDYAEIRSTIMERCDLVTVWEQHHEKYVRRLIDTVQTT